MAPKEGRRCIAIWGYVTTPYSRSELGHGGCRKFSPHPHFNTIIMYMYMKGHVVL